MQRILYCPLYNPANTITMTDAYLFETASDSLEFDLVNACKMCLTAYYSNGDGKQTLDEHPEITELTIGMLRDYVPNEFCEQFGFSKPIEIHAQDLPGTALVDKEHMTAHTKFHIKQIFATVDFDRPLYADSDHIAPGALKVAISKSLIYLNGETYSVQIDPKRANRLHFTINDVAPTNDCVLTQDMLKRIKFIRFPFQIGFKTTLSTPTKLTYLKFVGDYDPIKDCYPEIVVDPKILARAKFNM